MPDATLARPGARQSAWGRYRAQSLSVVALIVLAAVGAMALGAGVIAPGDPLRAAGSPLRPPTSDHWFGTDDLGRDVFAGVVYGSRPTLLVGTVAALASGLVGTLIGGIAGYFGGQADHLLMRLTELVQVVPRFFLVLIVAALFGPSIGTVTLLLGLTFWPSTARLVRAEVLTVRERPFVLAARGLGASEGRLLFGHVLPHALPVALVTTRPRGLRRLPPCSTAASRSCARPCPRYSRTCSSSSAELVVRIATRLTPPC